MSLNIFTCNELTARKSVLSCFALLGEKSEYFDKSEGYEVVLTEKESDKNTWHICWVGNRPAAEQIERFWQKNIMRAVRKMKKQKYYCEKVWE